MQASRLYKGHLATLHAVPRQLQGMYSYCLALRRPKHDIFLSRLLWGDHSR